MSDSTAYPTDAGCIFCRIVAGQIPCHKVYEDAQVLAFLDINPIARGHTLVVPKGHYPSLDRLAAVPQVGAACMNALARLSRALADATGAPAWNVLLNNGLEAGQLVDHVHFHIIPRREGDRLGFRWPADKLDVGAAKALIEAVGRALR